MTASANVRLVRSICEAWGRGDFGRAQQWADPNIEYVVADGPAPGTWTGLDQMAEQWRGWLAEWEGFRAEPDEFRDLDNQRVLALGHYSGRGKTSGLQVGQIPASAASVFYIRDRKVTKLVVDFDRERAFADLGLAPEARD
jgi:hypothetical protein